MFTRTASCQWLISLHGVIDSPDIPLNVSRSYLQADSNVKMISGYITKKVADRLEEIFKKDRSGANFFETVQQMKDILGANPIAYSGFSGLFLTQLPLA